MRGEWGACKLAILEIGKQLTTSLSHHKLFARKEKGGGANLVLADERLLHTADLTAQGYSRSPL